MDFDGNSKERKYCTYTGFYLVTPEIHTSQEPQNVTVFGNMFFVDLIMARIEIRNQTGLVLSENPMIRSFLPDMRQKGHRDTEEGNMQMEAEIRVMSLQAKEHQGFYVITGGRERNLRKFRPQRLQVFSTWRFPFHVSSVLNNAPCVLF